MTNFNVLFNQPVTERIRLKFEAGEYTAPEHISEDADFGFAGINVHEEGKSATWWDRVQVHGRNQAEAEALRDLILEKINEAEVTAYGGCRNKKGLPEES
jgi:hypothetical protein